MSWFRAIRPKVIESADNASSEKLRPDLMYHDARHQGVFLVDQPVCEVQAIRRTFARFEGMQSAQNAGFGAFSLLKEVPADMNVSVATILFMFREDRKFVRARENRF